jgi:hypothetical protein
LPAGAACGALMLSDPCVRGSARGCLLHCLAAPRSCSPCGCGTAKPSTSASLRFWKAARLLAVGLGLLSSSKGSFCWSAPPWPSFIHPNPVGGPEGAVLRYCGRSGIGVVSPFSCLKAVATPRRVCQRMLSVTSPIRPRLVRRHVSEYSGYLTSVHSVPTALSGWRFGGHVSGRVRGGVF